MLRPGKDAISRIMDVNLTALVTTAVTAVTLASNAFGVLDKLIASGRWLWRKVRPGVATGLPIKTVIAMVEPAINALWWGHSTFSGVPGMQVVGDFNVTNIWSGDVRLLVGLLRYRRGLVRHVVRCDPGVRDTKSVYTGPYPIPSGRTSHVRLDFMYPDRQRREEPGDFVADVGFVDQFGNHHWVRGLRFKHPEKMFT
jgi:hypothetical protein